MNRNLWDESELNNDGTFYQNVKGSMDSEELLRDIQKLDHDVLIITGIHDRNTGLSVTELLKNNLMNCKIEIFL
ncbi:hypothetical protein [Macrococcus epidermidis]|uniref:hypothetical protein n=1 Tax=Macrococcus epidermidis TaxID=1902580 RepID=UPI0020B77CFC|nr:hypothetical protein [Macrococcus epidermidis]UTH15043.1 hypothetical protein KFV12_06790 [Macrococcus epidermidis]